jgi:transposase
MYIRVKSSKLSPRKSVQIVKSVRTGKRVSQVILQHVGIAHDEKQLSELRELGRKLILEMEEKEQPSLPGFSLLENEEAWEWPVGDGERVNLRGMKNLEQVTEGPGEVVESLFSSLGFEEIFGVSSRGKGNTEVLKKCLACALANPSSKRGMSRWLEDEGGTDMSLNRIYRMMDALAKKTDRVREIVARETASLFEMKASLLLFDVTTLYFESFEADDLRVPGYSKDNRIQETQVVLALAVTPEGFPLWYDLFPGNTFEGHTLVPVLRRCMETFSPRQAVVVADRAMFTEENLHEVEKAGCSFVVGAKLRGLSRAMRDKILDAGNYSPLPGGSPVFPEEKNEREEREEREEETCRPSRWYSAPLGNGRNLLVTWSERRARKDASDRERLLARLRKKLQGKKTLPGKSLVTNRGTNKYLSLENANGQDRYILDEEKILRDSRWDGLHGVITDLPAESAAEAQDILAHYGSLWRIEESFRVNKHDLSIRPVYHWVPRRIEAHIALTYLAFALLRHLQHRLAVRQNAVMSARAIRTALLDVQSTLMKDGETGKLYRFPKAMSESARKIYRSLGLVRGLGNTEILSVRKYRNRKGIRSAGTDGDGTMEEGTGRN